MPLKTKTQKLLFFFFHRAFREPNQCVTVSELTETRVEDVSVVSAALTVFFSQSLNNEHTST